MALAPSMTGATGVRVIARSLVETQLRCGLALAAMKLGHVLALEEKVDVRSQPAGHPGTLTAVRHVNDANPQRFWNEPLVKPFPDGRPIDSEPIGDIEVSEQIGFGIRVTGSKCTHENRALPEDYLLQLKRDP